MWYVARTENVHCSFCPSVDLPPSATTLFCVSPAPVTRHCNRWLRSISARLITTRSMLGNSGGRNVIVRGRLVTPTAFVFAVVGCPPPPMTMFWVASHSLSIVIHAPLDAAGLLAAISFCRRAALTTVLYSSSNALAVREIHNDASSTSSSRSSAISSSCAVGAFSRLDVLAHSSFC